MHRPSCNTMYMMKLEVNMILSLAELWTELRCVVVQEEALHASARLQHNVNGGA